MKYRFLGRSGLRVSRICLGTMTFGNNSWGCEQDEATAITNLFVDSGGNFIDTADLYSTGESERMLGKAIKAHKRDDLVVATKCWFSTGDNANARGLSRKHITEACEASLTRMETDYIDLYQIHGPDPYTPIEETMRALDDLVRSGKVRYIGCSNLYAWQIVKAQLTAVSAGFERFISAQHLYNLIRRDVEREILPACDDLGIGLICWSPLASGMLTGKYAGSSAPDADSRFGKQASTYMDRYWFDGSLHLVEALVESAQQLGKSAASVSLAWLLSDQRITAPIVGARTAAQLKDSLEAGDWDLPAEHRRSLTDALPINHGYPKDWMDVNFKGTLGVAEFSPRHTQRRPE